MKVIVILSYILVIIGALNWGLIAAFQFNAVEAVFGSMPMLVRIIYGLVGLGGLVLLFTAKHWCRCYDYGRCDTTDRDRR